jgi:hypothetical protein
MLNIGSKTLVLKPWQPVILMVALTGVTMSILTERRIPALLDTLAAAYAEAGDFSRAISTIEEALNRARTSGDSDAIKLSEGFLHHFMAIFPTVKSRNKPIKSPV